MPLTTYSAGDVLTAASLNANLVFAAANPTSAVLQVKSTTKDDTFTTSSTSLVDVTGLAVTITPTSASNKVLVMVHMSTAMDGANTNGVYPTLFRDATLIGGGVVAGSRVSIATDQGITSFSNGTNNLSFNFLDSPATTAATTYKIQVKTETAVAIAVNRSRTDGNNSGVGRSISTITVMEVTP